MVELTEITEEAQFLEQQATNAYNSGKVEQSSDEEDYSSEGEDDYNENETFYDRIIALRDIIPPRQMSTLRSMYSTTKSLFRTAFSKGGNIMWALTTSALLLGVPLSLSILGEQQLIEMEKGFDLQKDANDILTASDTTASAAPAGL